MKNGIYKAMGQSHELFTFRQIERRLRAHCKEKHIYHEILAKLFQSSTWSFSTSYSAMFIQDMSFRLVIPPDTSRRIDLEIYPVVYQPNFRVTLEWLARHPFLPIKIKMITDEDGQILNYQS